MHQLILHWNTVDSSLLSASYLYKGFLEKFRTCYAESDKKNFLIQYDTKILYRLFFHSFFKYRLFTTLLCRSMFRARYIYIYSQCCWSNFNVIFNASYKEPVQLKYLSHVTCKQCCTSDPALDVIPCLVQATKSQCFWSNFNVIFNARFKEPVQLEYLLSHVQRKLRRFSTATFNVIPCSVQATQSQCCWSTARPATTIITDRSAIHQCPWLR